MKIIEMKTKIIPDEKNVNELYSDAGWNLYTNNMESLMGGLKNSLLIVTLWEDEKLIGLARVVGDGKTIVYLQDILILKSHQRMGLGTKMMKFLFDEYHGVRQFVLMTDDTENKKAFYKSNGFIESGELNAVSFIKAD